MIKPDIYVKDITEINYTELKKKGIKLLCFDLDNTLDKPDRNTEKIDENIERTLTIIEKMGFEIFVISNNTIEGRVASFADIRKYKYVEAARKPFAKTYKKNEVINSYSKTEVAFIGDKIVTDIIGANRFGYVSILVDPLYPGTKHWYTEIMRISELILTTLVRFKRGKYYG